MFSRCLSYLLLSCLIAFFACTREQGLFEDLPKRKAGPQILHEAQALPDLLQQAEAEPQLVPKQKTEISAKPSLVFPQKTETPKENDSTAPSASISAEKTLPPKEKNKNHPTSWEICWKCHDPKTPEKAVPLVVKTERNKIATVQFPQKFPSHAHPLTSDCLSCHKTQLQPALVTPIEKKFSHGKHLEGIEPSAFSDECLLCHNTVNTSVQTDRELFARSACEKCHGGKIAIEVRAETKPNPLFQHKEHAKVPQGCVACHPLDSQKNPGTEGNCKLCHDHWNKKDSALPSLNDCADCHLPAEVWRALKSHEK